MMKLMCHFVNVYVHPFKTQNYEIMAASVSTGFQAAYELN